MYENKSNLESKLFELIQGLWTVSSSHPFYKLLPQNPESLRNTYSLMKEFVASHTTSLEGFIDPEAIIQGSIIAMGKGSVIEAGAIIHESCQLFLGDGSRIRSGAVLRDEVLVGSGCLIGVNCEVVRSIILGPNTALSHLVFIADSIVGRDVNVAGNVIIANTPTRHGASINLRFRGKRVDSGRSHLGVLVGDGVRFGASTTVCPGCIVLPNLTLPPQVVLLGTIDHKKREKLMSTFFSLWGD